MRAWAVSLSAVTRLVGKRPIRRGHAVGGNGQTTPSSVTQRLSTQRADGTASIRCSSSCHCSSRFFGASTSTGSSRVSAMISAAMPSWTVLPSPTSSARTKRAWPKTSSSRTTRATNARWCGARPTPWRDAGASMKGACSSRRRVPFRDLHDAATEDALDVLDHDVGESAGIAMRPERVELRLNPGDRGRVLVLPQQLVVAAPGLAGLVDRAEKAGAAAVGVADDAGLAVDQAEGGVGQHPHVHPLRAQSFARRS